MANRRYVDAVDGLLCHGANVDALYARWDSEVTAMQLAILANHPAVVNVDAVVQLSR
jgi:hypothetical protein